MKIEDNFIAVKLRIKYTQRQPLRQHDLDFVYIFLSSNTLLNKLEIMYFVIYV
jgi:hypothetical protein